MNSPANLDRGRECAWRI